MPTIDSSSCRPQLPLFRSMRMVGQASELLTRYLKWALAVCAVVTSLLPADAAASAPRVLSGTISLPANGASMRRKNLPKTKISALKPERWFRIKVPSATVLNVTVTGPFYKPNNGLRGKSSALHELTADIDCQLLDVNSQLLQGSDRSGLSAEFLRRVPLAAGTYYLRVGYRAAGPELDRTDILVLLSAGADWDVVTSATNDDGAGEAHHVGLLPLPGKGPLQSDRATWITTHGRSDAPGSREDGPGTFFQIAKALARLDLTSQQALMDWTTAAAPKSSLDLSEGRWFRKIGVALAQRLADTAQPRFSGDELSFVGHSWGTYVNYEIVHSVRNDVDGGKATRFIALDPALTASNYDVTGANFSGDADYSLAFYTSSFGSQDVAQTANDAFKVDVRGTENIFTEHNAAHEFFHDLLGQTDRISTALRSALLNRGSTVWERDPSFYTHMMTGRATSMMMPIPSSQDFEGLLSIIKSEGYWKPVSLMFAQP